MRRRAAASWCGAAVYLANRDEEQLTAVEEPAVRTAVWDVVCAGALEALLVEATAVLGASA